MFAGLAAEIDGLDIPVDAALLASAVQLADRLTAKVTMAAAAFDGVELWDVEGQVSMAAWLRVEGKVSNADARRTVALGRRLRACPVTASAWETGVLSSGQVHAIVANLNNRTAVLFAEHEATLVPHLASLDVGATTVAMQEWAVRAKALLGDVDPEEREGHAHLSPLLDGRGRLDATLDANGYQMARKAIRFAMGRKVDGDPRTVGERRHDALVAVFGHYLDHQNTSAGGHHRPHVNIVIDAKDLLTGKGQGTFLDDGTPISAADALRMACDANVHRFITNGRSTVLDYGHTTRNVTPDLFTVIAERDRGCRFPGCDRPVDACHAHHVTHWYHGGTTNPGNLALFCTRHHHVIHRPRWHVKLQSTGTIEITDPEGRVRTSHPPQRE